MPRITKQAIINEQAQEILRLEQELEALGKRKDYPSPLSNTRVAPSWKERYIQSQLETIQALNLELAQAEQAKGQEQSYIKALAKLDLEKKELQAELAQAKQALELVQADSREFRDERNELQELAESQAEKLVLLEARHKSLTIAFDKADEKLAKQVQEIAYANKIVSQAEQAEKQAKQALDNTESLLWDTQAELNKLKQELAQVKPSLEALQAELAYEKSVISSYDRRASEAEQALQDHKQALDLCKQELDQRASQAQAKQAEHKQELAQAWEAHKKAQAMYFEKLGEVQKLEAELSSLQAELNKTSLSLQGFEQAQAKQAEQASLQALASPQEPELEQELAYFKSKLAQALQALQAEQEKHKQALTREKGLRADIEGTSLQLEQVQAELAQAYEQGEKEYQAVSYELGQVRINLDQAHIELAQVYKECDEAEKELAKLKSKSKSKKSKGKKKQAELFQWNGLASAQHTFAGLQASMEAQEIKALKQELAYYKLERAWDAGYGLLGSTITKLYKLRQKYNPPTPEKQGLGKALEQELALVLDTID